MPPSTSGSKGSSAKWRSPTRSWRIRATSGSSPARAGRRSGEGRAVAARAVGEHRQQEPALQRRAVRRRADRPGHREHHSAGDARRLPRSRPPARQPGGKRRRGDAVLDDLEKSGISLRKVTDDLLATAWASSSSRSRSCCAPSNAARVRRTRRASTRSRSRCPQRFRRTCRERLKAWDADGGTRRLFAGDASLWTGTDEASWIGWLGIVDQQIEDGEDAARPAAGGPQGRLHARAAARHGRIEPVSGSLEGDIRHDPRLAGAVRARLDRSRADPGDRVARSISHDALHRLEQVGLDARAEHLQGVLLRPGEAGGRRRQSRQPLHCRDRSGIEPGEGGAEATASVTSSPA